MPIGESSRPPLMPQAGGEVMERWGSFKSVFFSCFKAYLSFFCCFLYVFVGVLFVVLFVVLFPLGEFETNFFVFHETSQRNTEEGKIV